MALLDERGLAAASALSVRPGKAAILPSEPTSALIEWRSGEGPLDVDALVIRDGAGNRVFYPILARAAAPRPAGPGEVIRFRIPLFSDVRREKLIFASPGTYELRLIGKTGPVAGAALDVVAAGGTGDPGAEAVIHDRGWLREFFSGWEEVRLHPAPGSIPEPGGSPRSVFRGYLAYARGIRERDEALKVRLEPEVSPRDFVKQRTRKRIAAGDQFQAALQLDLDPYFRHRAMLELAVCRSLARDLDAAEKLLRDALAEPDFETELARKAHKLLVEIARLRKDDSLAPSAQ
jgi:hypothetical protein